MEHKAIKIKNFLGRFHVSIHFTMQTILTAIVLSGLCLYYVNPFSNVEISKWDRTVGIATLSGVSIDNRVHNFYIYFLVILPVVFFAIWLILSLILKNKEVYLKSLNKISIVAFVPVLVAYINRFTTMEADEIAGNSMMTMLLYYIVLVLLFSVLDRKGLFAEQDILFLLLFYMLMVLSCRVYMTDISRKKPELIVGIVLLLFFVAVQKCNVNKDTLKKLEYFLSFLLWIPTIMCLMLEALYVLNGREILFLSNYEHIIQIGVLLITLIVAVIILVLNKIGHAFSGGTRINYVGGLISVGAILASCPYQKVWDYGAYAWLYETSNLTASMDTITQGKLPIIDYFSAHALSDSYGGILYAWINQDAKGIITSPYGGIGNIALLLICYIILKEFFEEEVAMLVVMLFPFSVGNLKWSHFCMISILAGLYLLKKKSNLSYVVFWITLALGLCLRYDDGMSLGIGCIIAIIIIILFGKTDLKIKKLIVSGAGVSGVLGVFYFVYCAVTGVDAIRRIKEWITVGMQSTSTWATYSFGDATTYAFEFSYFIVPLVITVVTIAGMIWFVRNKTQEKYVFLLLVFAFTGILFWPRTIAFHNLAVCKGSTGVLFNYFPWLLVTMVSFWCVIKDKPTNVRYMSVLCSFGAIIYIIGVSVTEQLPTNFSSIYYLAEAKAESIEIKGDKSKLWNTERNVYSENTQEFINQFDDIFSVLLEDDETFVDFANITCLYALVDRVRPSYVSQLPSLLTNEASQEYFIEEAESYKTPLVIVGITDESHATQMFGIPHTIRYYVVAEYIYDKYRPLVSVGDFAIWCEKDKYEEYKTCLEESGVLNEARYLIDYGYDAGMEVQDENGNIVFLYKNDLHNYDVGELPYIWANYDDENADENQTLCEITENGNGSYSFEGSDSIQTEDGNYLAFYCEYQAKEDEIGKKISVTLSANSNSNIRYSYSFTPESGKNLYLLRVSQDYFWTAYNIDTIEFSSDVDFSVSEVRVLQGD